ncbi:cytochrome P450 [Pilatotrama ljubarskyi]|nr:cytochrome P450 [Pilatotrama ljubarskyi]
MSFTLIALTAAPLYLVSRLLQTYFTRSPLDPIPGPSSGSLLTGNLAQLLEHDNHDFVNNLVNTYGTVAKIHGPFGTRWLHVYDPRAIHSVLVKDVNQYGKGVGSDNGLQLLLGPGLLATNGERHRRQRKMLNPVFSGAYMRSMTPFFYDIIGKLRSAILAQVSTGEKEVDIAGWMARTALELIGQGGLGHSFDPLIEETRDEYTEAVKALIPAIAEVGWSRIFLPFIHYLGPPWFRRMLLDLVPHKGVQRLKNIVDIMHSRSVELYRERKAAAMRGEESLSQNIAEGKDIMSVLLKANLQASEEDKLPDEEVLAQMSTFILAGTDTTSNALSRVLYLLAMHPAIQDKLRAELVDAHERYGDNIPYDELMQLHYLDAVCRETLRLHAPSTMVFREAFEDTILPLMTPIRTVDGRHVNEIAVPKGTLIVLNVRACNTNKALWGEDADKWRPERWLEPLPRELEEARIPGVYSNLMTFGAGSYSCIGFKFSQLEMKVVLSSLVRTFSFDLPDKPIKWNSAAVDYPTMGGPDTARAEMLLKIKAV